MYGYFVIMYHATTETGKEFNYFGYAPIKMGYNMLNMLRTTHEDNGIMKFTIEVKGCYQFKTKKEAAEFTAHNNKGADHNGTGLDAFLKEINGES